jgi:hypothetical protein
MKTNFITFGAGGKSYNDAGKRLVNQANSTKLFDTTKMFTDVDLRADIEFWKQHGEFIQRNRRGYGYWLWKPYIIKKTMDAMSDGDILLYLDCGCEIDTRESAVLSKYFEYVKTDLVIGTQTQIEKFWDKMDLVLHLGMSDSPSLHTPQRQGGAVLYCVCDKTRELVNMWYKTCCDYHLIDDTPSVASNIAGFRQHRHDQSVFSLLSKKYGLFSKKSLHECVVVQRNRSGVSKLQ